MRSSASLSTDQKVEILFSYLFSDSTAEEEELFWNRLTDAEIAELKKVQKEEMIPFSHLKKHA